MWRREKDKKIIALRIRGDGGPLTEIRKCEEGSDLGQRGDWAQFPIF